jgi:hypothetical protein
MFISLIKRNHLVSYMWYLLLGGIAISHTACVHQMKYSSFAADTCKSLIHFPKANYMRIKGEGENIKQAIRQGKSEISRILSAQIDSIVELKAQQNSKEIIETVTENIKVSTQFQHAELIKTIPQCKACTDDGQCYAWLTLSRHAVAQRLESDIIEDVALLHKATQKLQISTPILIFSQAWYQSHAIRQSLRPILNQLKVLGRMSPKLIQVEALMTRSAQMKAQRFEKLRILMHSPSINIQQPEVSNQIKTQIKEVLGVQIQKALTHWHLKPWKEVACPTSTKEYDVLELKPNTHISCQLGLIGPQCKLDLSLAISLCNHSPTLSNHHSNKQWTAVHTHHVTRALQKLVKQLEQQDFSILLHKSLSPLIAL